MGSINQAQRRIVTVRVMVDRSHALRGNASLDALRPLLNVTQSVTGCIPTRERGNDH